MAFFMPVVITLGVLFSPKTKQAVKDYLNNRWAFRILLFIVIFLFYLAYVIGRN